MENHGLIQIYTGNGKGKTTASLGLAMRAAGWGKNILIYQFLKPETLELGERKFIESLNRNIKLKVLDESWNMWTSLDNPAHIEKVKLRIHEELTAIAKLAKTNQYDIIILDEIVFCQSKNLADINDIKKIIQNKNPQTELIMTGRNATGELIELADLVSQINPIKHPYEKGITARKAIEY
jgi:cob(I)alamin adenosyltransferase